MPDLLCPIENSKLRRFVGRATQMHWMILDRKEKKMKRNIVSRDFVFRL
jgi:hypothetical protein